MGCTVSLPHSFVFTATAFISGVFAGLIFHTVCGDSTHGDIYLGWWLGHVHVHLRDLLNHLFGPLTIPLLPLRNHVRQKLFRLLCGRADVSVWWNLIHPIALPCLLDPVGDICTPGLSSAIKSWHHVNTDRQYSLTRKVRNSCFMSLITKKVRQCVLSSVTSWFEHTCLTLHGDMHGRYILLKTEYWNTRG